MGVSFQNVCGPGKAAGEVPFGVEAAALPASCRTPDPEAVTVEFVHPEDPMAKRLLANKPEGLFPDYRRDAFEQLLAARCEITRREELPGGTRTLYAGVRRG